MSKIIPIFKVEVNEKKELLWPKEKIKKYLYTLWPGEYELIIRKPNKPTSDRQRKYYFGVIVKILCEETGNDDITVHDFLKCRFLPDGIDSTETFTTTEREDYHQKIRDWASEELSYYIPLPNEVIYD